MYGDRSFAIAVELKMRTDGKGKKGEKEIKRQKTEVMKKQKKKSFKIG